MEDLSCRSGKPINNDYRDSGFVQCPLRQIGLQPNFRLRVALQAVDGADAPWNVLGFKRQLACTLINGKGRTAPVRTC